VEQNSWQLQEAKARFSELVKRALEQGAQIVTRHGKNVVVVMPYKDYEELTRPLDSLSHFLRESPLGNSQLLIERDRNLPREGEIEH
jgi:antitoxin Phd